MREVRVSYVTKPRKKVCLFRYHMLLKPGQKGTRNAISASQRSMSGFKAALAGQHVFFPLVSVDKSSKQS